MSTNTVPKHAIVTIFSEAVYRRLDELGIGDDIRDEVLWLIKGVEPGHRIPYLNEMFSADEAPDDDF